MATSFALHVLLTDDGETDEVTRQRIVEAQEEASNEAFLVRSRGLRISLMEEDLNSAPSYAAIFVPSTLVQASLQQVDLPVLSSEGSPVIAISPSDQSRLSLDLLCKVHPFLASNFCIKAVISVQNELHAPSDVLLIDLCHAPQAAIADLLEAMNGQMIHVGPEAVLKVLLVSKLEFTLSNETFETTASLSRVEIPCCPVCLHRIDPLHLGLPRPQNRQLCSKFCPSPNLALFDGTVGEDACPRQRLLRPWSRPSHCVACHVIETYWKAGRSGADESSDLFCCQCAMQETLWVCLTCGFVGCGRYSNKHAAQHYTETRHPYSLELATLRIWYYVGGEFAHRVDLLECPSSPPLVLPWIRQSSRTYAALPDSSTLTPSTDAAVASTIVSDAGFISAVADEKSPKKATMIGEEYEALLQSALEEQAQHYEGEITRLRAELTAEHLDMENMTKEEAESIQCIKDEVAALRAEIDRSSRDLLDLQSQEAGHRATSQRLLREQQVSEDLLKKIREEAANEHEQGRMQIEELEQQIADLTANQRMRREFSNNDELLNAQIFGTTSAEPPKSSTKKGKKGRRFFRKS